MRWSILLLIATATCVAQSGPCTEAAIRNAIQSKNIPGTDDEYVYSGRLNKPLIGKVEQENYRQIQRENSGESTAIKTDASSQTQPQRIVVASSGDMAYEFGTQHIVRDLQNGQHQDFTTAYLRVWRAVGNSCLVAAMQVAPENLHDLLTRDTNPQSK